jgi:Protein of unknown function (DUF1559)
MPFSPSPRFEERGQKQKLVTKIPAPIQNRKYQMKTLHTNLRIPLQAMFFLFFAILSLKAFADDMLVAKQFINGTTIAIARIDTKRIGLPDEPSQELDADAPLKKVAKPFALVLENFADALNGEPVFIAVDIPFSSEVSPVRLYVRNSSKVNAKKLAALLAGLQFTNPVVQGEFLCVSFAQSTESSNKIAIGNDILPVARADFDAAMNELGDLPIQVLILPPDYVRTTFRELLPTLPAKFGGGPTSTLTDGLRWTAISIDPTKLRLQAVTKSSSLESAKAFNDHFPKLLASLSDSIPLLKKHLRQLLPLMKRTQTGDKLTLSIEGDAKLAKSVAIISNVMEQLLGPMTSQIKMDRFKKIGLAIHNYESANRVLPPGKEGRDENGKSYLSWRVHILPYLGQVELYKQFRLKEPWDSEHNLKLLKQMPDVYKIGSNGMDSLENIKPGYTSFLAPVGEGTIFGGQKPRKFAEVSDGLSNTIWLVEVKAGLAKPWTAPEDFAFDAENPGLGLEAILSERPTFLCGMGDGSVTQLPLSLPAKTILDLYQMNDGNVIDLQ